MDIYLALAGFFQVMFFGLSGTLATKLFDNNEFNATIYLLGGYRHCLLS